MSRTSRLGLAAGLIVLVGLVAFGLLSGFTSFGRASVSASGPLTSGTSPSASQPVTPTAPGSAGSAPPTPNGSAGASPGATPAASPPASKAALAAPSGAVADAVARRIAAVGTKGLSGRIGGEVMNVATGAVLYNRSGTSGFTPASTNKLLTTTTALQLLGPNHRFQTTVVHGPGRQIILVGGGDPYLMAKPGPSPLPARPTLQQLAASAAAKLKAAHQTTVTLGYDTSLFTGPSWNPNWPKMYHDQVTPVSSLWVREGRVTPFGNGPRVKNAPQDAAEQFADNLQHDGIKVARVTPARAAATAPKLAVVKSLPLRTIVEHLLLVSDNDAAEVLFRQAAIAAGRPASFSGGQLAVHDTLTELGVWDPATRVYDGSGLSRQGQVPPDMMVRILRLDLSAGHPQLRSVVSQLPVAGKTGSLRVHFFSPGTTASRGRVRAKTGLLSQVHALAGYVRTDDGAVVAFDFVVNGAKNDYNAEIWTERAVTAVATCGCSP